MESTYNLPGPNQDNNIYIYYDIESDIYESSFKSYVSSGYLLFMENSILLLLDFLRIID